MCASRFSLQWQRMLQWNRIWHVGDKIMPRAVKGSKRYPAPNAATTAAAAATTSPAKRWAIGVSFGYTHTHTHRTRAGGSEMEGERERERQTLWATNAVAAVVLICLFAVIIPCALDLKLKLGHTIVTMPHKGRQRLWHMPHQERARASKRLSKCHRRGRPNINRFKPLSLSLFLSFLSLVRTLPSIPILVAWFNLIFHTKCKIVKWFNCK